MEELSWNQGGTRKGSVQNKNIFLSCFKYYRLGSYMNINQTFLNQYLNSNQTFLNQYINSFLVVMFFNVKYITVIYFELSEQAQSGLRIELTFEFKL